VKISNLLPLVGILLFFSACSTKHRETPLLTEPKLILFSTKNFRFYDAGFIKRYVDRLELEIFSAGTLVLHLEIFPDTICLNGECASKKRVVQELFGQEYHQEILDDILLGRDIAGYSVTYERSADRILFKDEKNRVLLLIKRL